MSSLLRYSSKLFAAFVLVVGVAMPYLVSAATTTPPPAPAATFTPAGGGNPNTTFTAAGGGNPNSNGLLVNPLKADSLEELLMIVLDAAIKLGGIVITLALIWVGFLFVKAQGNPTEIKKAREALVYVVIGALILLGAKAILTVIQDTVNSLAA